MENNPTSLDQQTASIEQQTAAIVGNDSPLEKTRYTTPEKSTKQASSSSSSWWQNSLILRALVIGVALLGGGLFSLYTMIAGDYIIDNPSSTEIVVSLGGSEYTIASGSYEKVSLPRGDISLELYLNGKLVGNVRKGRLEGGSIINPTQSLYIRSNIIYQTDESNTETAKNNGDLEWTSLCLNGKEYRDYNMKTYTGLYLSHDRDYGPGNPSPESVSIKNDYVIKRELLSQKQFMNFFDPEDLEDCE